MFSKKIVVGFYLACHLRGCSITSNQVWIDLEWVPIHITIHDHEKFMDLNHNSVGREKIQVRVLSDIVNYLLIDNPYRLNENPRVEKVLEFNPTKGLCERHGFTQSNEGLKS
jgi:hypothetical protein